MSRRIDPNNNNTSCSPDGGGAWGAPHQHPQQQPLTSLSLLRSVMEQPQPHHAQQQQYAVPELRPAAASSTLMERLRQSGLKRARSSENEENECGDARGWRTPAPPTPVAERSEVADGRMTSGISQALARLRLASSLATGGNETLAAAAAQPPPSALPPPPTSSPSSYHSSSSSSSTHRLAGLERLRLATSSLANQTLAPKTAAPTAVSARGPAVTPTHTAPPAAKGRADVLLTFSPPKSNSNSNKAKKPPLRAGRKAGGSAAAATKREPVRAPAKTQPPSSKTRVGPPPSSSRAAAAATVRVPARAAAAARRGPPVGAGAADPAAGPRPASTPPRTGRGSVSSIHSDDLSTPLRRQLSDTRQFLERYLSAPEPAAAPFGFSADGECGRRSTVVPLAQQSQYYYYSSHDPGAGGPPPPSAPAPIGGAVDGRSGSAAAAVRRGGGGGTHVVFDTSSFLQSDNGVLNLLVDKWVLAVPYVVVNELDRFNKRSWRAGKGDAEWKAHRARELRDWLAGHHSAAHADGTPAVRIQKRTDVVDEYDRHAQSDDDRILGFAVFLQRRGERVLFVTEDKFLSLKATAELGSSVNYHKIKQMLGVRH